MTQNAEAPVTISCGLDGQNIGHQICYPRNIREMKNVSREQGKTKRDTKVFLKRVILGRRGLCGMVYRSVLQVW